MTQAARVYSTPPTNTSLTRRGALGAIAAATAVTVAGARPTDAAPVIDPIYAAIEAHRKAAAVEQAAWDEVNRRYELGEKFSPSEEDALTDGPNVAASYALDEFAATIPTTLPGLLAMIVYASEADDVIPEAFNLCQQSLVTAAQTLMDGRVS
jgi:hypothetical protein